MCSMYVYFFPVEKANVLHVSLFCSSTEARLLLSWSAILLLRKGWRSVRWLEQRALCCVFLQRRLIALVLQRSPCLSSKWKVYETLSKAPNDVWRPQRYVSHWLWQDIRCNEGSFARLSAVLFHSRLFLWVTSLLSWRWQPISKRCKLASENGNLLVTSS